MRARSGVAGPLLLAPLLVALVALGPAADAAGAVQFTFIGDSKAAAIELTPKAKRLLRRGHDVRRDLEVCRRLVAPSCPYNGETPLTALEAVTHYGPSLGTVLVIDVGYNDNSATYRNHLNQVMGSALSNGVEGVVWVNLRAVRQDYRRINRIIRRAKERFPRLYVANWNRYSRGHADWVRPRDEGGDGIHLTGAGAVGLVRLVRRYVPLAAEGPRDGSEVVVELPAAGEVEDAAADLTADSPPVGPNIGAQDDGSTGLSGVLPFAAGAALMLFLVFVTLKRRGAA